MRIPTLLLLSGLLHLYIGLRLLEDLPWPAAGPWLALLLLLSALFVPAGLLARRLARPPVANTLAWIGLVFMGLFSSLFVFTLLRDLLLLLASGGAVLLGAGWPAELRGITSGAVPLLALAATLVGFLNARRTAQVVTVDIPLAGLPAALEGLRVVQITDVHVGPTIRQAYLEAIVERVNRLKPDIVAITGDLVDGSVAELRPHVAPLAKLNARLGTFFVTGNHEYYSGVQGWVDELRRLGVQVLLNEHVVLTRNGAGLVLAGVTDYSAAHFEPGHASDPATALRGAPPGLPRVLLAHQPRSATAAAAAGFDLQLSGHTHGGQFLPWTYFVPLQQPFTAGLHRLGRLWVYVSRGTGYWGPPKRLGAPSEITELRLVRAVSG